MIEELPAIEEERQALEEEHEIMEEARAEEQPRPPVTLMLTDEAGQKRLISEEPEGYWMQRKSKQRREERETQEAFLAVETKTSPVPSVQSQELAWVKFLTGRCGKVELALAALADGAKVSKRQDKLLERRVGKPGRSELRERDLPGHLKGALAEAKIKEWSGWAQKRYG